MGSQARNVDFLERTIKDVTNLNAISAWHDEHTRTYPSSHSPLQEAVDVRYIQPEDIPNVVKNLPQEVKDTTIEHQMLGMLADSVRSLSWGESVSQCEGLAFEITAISAGVIMRSSRYRNWYPLSKLRESEYKSQPVPVGSTFTHRVVETHTRPEIGGMVIMAKGLGYTALEGLVNPDTAEPRVELKIVESDYQSILVDNHLRRHWQGKTNHVTEQS